MKLTTLVAIAALSALTLAPTITLAHERQVYQIDGTKYLFTVGSLGEPTYVDDKSGVDLKVKIADPNDPSNGNAAGAKPAEGLDQTLKVEVSAGDKKQTFDLEPAYNNPGAYTATFFPTVATTYNYRFFGTINNNPVDITFTCKSGNDDAPSQPDTNAIKISDKIIRTYQTGKFSCPQAKEEITFPEKTSSQVSLMQSTTETKQNSSKTPLTLSIIALAISLITFAKPKRS